VHDVADLQYKAAFLATQFSGRRRVVAMVSAHHLYVMIWAALSPTHWAPVVMHTIGAPLGLTMMNSTLISYALDMVAKS
jgi:hypothetical protein